VWIPVTKGLFQALIEHLSAHLQHQMCAFLRPLHLLLFGKPLTYDLVYRRFHKARRNRFLITPAFAVIWNECLVGNAAIAGGVSAVGGAVDSSCEMDYCSQSKRPYNNT
jgi:hypothetical protein